MSTLIGAIAIFAIGYILNTLTGVPALVVGIACPVAIVGLLLLNNRKGKTK